MSRKHCTVHGKPITRREFISRGLVAGTGMVLGPSLFSLIGQKLYAGPPPLKTPFLVFDLAGGAALPANFLVGGKGGPQDLLKSYDILGWNPKQVKIDSRFGLPMPDASVGRILNGMLTNMSAEAQARFRMSSFLHTGLIDTTQNPLSIMSLVNKVGTIGSRIFRPIGTVSSLSGGNSRPAFSNEEYRPILVDSVNNLINATGFVSSFPKFSESTTLQIVRTLSKLSTRQLSQISADPETSDAFVKKHLNAETLLIASREMDGRLDPIFTQLYGINQNTDPKNINVIRASIVKAVLGGYSGPGAITIGGCDYHDNSQTTGDTKDNEIGVEIGRAIEAAHRMGKPLFIHVITDGGIYARAGSRVWLGDSNETCMSVIGYYDPKGAPKYVNNQIQIGHYSDQQGSDRTTLIGDSPQLAAYAAFANYLNIEGRISEFEKLVPGIFNANQLDSVLSLTM